MSDPETSSDPMVSVFLLRRLSAIVASKNTVNEDKAHTTLHKSERKTGVAEKRERGGFPIAAASLTTLLAQEHADDSMLVFRPAFFHQSFFVWILSCAFFILFFCPAFFVREYFLAHFFVETILHSIFAMPFLRLCIFPSDQLFRLCMF